MTRFALRSLALLLLPGIALADELNAGDTAWILASTALVLFMTLPGLALFYGGLVRTRNVLSVLMQCFAICGVVTLLWVTVGYSLAFGEGNAWIGDFSKVMLAGVGPDSLSGTIPEPLFAVFQLTFAIITPALIIGGFAERMRFGAMLWMQPEETMGQMRWFPKKRQLELILPTEAAPLYGEVAQSRLMSLAASLDASVTVRIRK